MNNREYIFYAECFILRIIEAAFNQLLLNLKVNPLKNHFASNRHEKFLPRFDLKLIKPKAEQETATAYHLIAIGLS